MRKLLLPVAVLGLFLSPLAGTARADHEPRGPHPDGSEGCIANPYATAVKAYVDHCNYTARRNGGYVASGSSWTITVKREGQAAKPAAAPDAVQWIDVDRNGTIDRSIITFSAANGAADDCDTAIAAGDVVKATTGAGTDNVVMVGNNLPSATDGALAPVPNHEACWSA